MLTRDEQRIAHRFGGWPIVDALTGHLERIHEYGGRSPFWSDSTDSMEYNRRKIAVGGPHPMRNPHALTVTWAAIVKHGANLPQSLRDRLDANRRECTRWATFGAKLPAYGRNDIVDRWCKDAYRKGWHEWARRVDAARVLLLDEAFPLAAEESEPTDLLELLAAGA